MKSDLQKYIEERKGRDASFAVEWNAGWNEFYVGAMLIETRLRAFMTQEELVERLGTNKSAISRMERHTSDSRLSTLERAARAMGFRLRIEMKR